MTLTLNRGNEGASDAYASGPKHAAASREQRRRGKAPDAFWAIALIVGLIGMLYPVTSTLVNNHRNAVIAEQTRVETHSLPDIERDAAMNDMRAFNEELKLHPASEFTIDGDHSRPEYQRYLNAGRVGGQDVIAQVVVPSANIALPVYRGTSDEVLRKGAGHLFGTTLPIGGEGSNATISAHTGMVNASMFDNLNQVKPGDDIYVTVLGETLRYQMTGSKVVPPDALDAIPPPGTPGDHLYLLTCTPYGLNFHRLVVEAVRVPMPDAPPPELEETTNVLGGWQWWMWLSLGFAALVVLLLLIPIVLRKRRSP